MQFAFIIVFTFLSVFPFNRALDSINDNDELVQDILRLIDATGNDNYIEKKNVDEIILSRLLENLSRNKDELNQEDSNEGSSNEKIDDYQMETYDSVEKLPIFLKKFYNSKPDSLILYNHNVKKTFS